MSFGGPYNPYPPPPPNGGPYPPPPPPHPPHGGPYRKDSEVAAGYEHAAPGERIGFASDVGAETELRGDTSE